jgi:hypothetical protein
MSNEPTVQKINSSGNGLSIQFGQPAEKRPEALPTGARAQEGGTVRAHADGRVEHEGVRRASDAPPAPSADPFDSGMTQTGFRRARHQLTQDDLVMHQGVETRIRELLSLGLAEPDPAGGFKMKAQQPSSQQEQQAKAPEFTTEKLSAQGEAAIGSIVQTLGAENAVAILHHVSESNEIPNLGELASRMQTEPQVLSETIARVTNEMTTQARRVLGMDEDSYEQFSQWAYQHAPEERREAITRVFEYGDYRAAKALAARFRTEGASGWSDAELAEIPLGTGGESAALSKDERGRPLITIPGYGTMLLRAAIQQKLVSVRRG